MILLEDFKDSKLRNIISVLSRSDRTKLKNLFQKIEAQRNKARRYRRKKKGRGMSVTYDYDFYKDVNREVAKGDYDALVDKIDLERTNIADVAREVLPDHTNEGGQSQLRKVLTHERPLTTPMAKKLARMIASGKIAVK